MLLFRSPVVCLLALGPVIALPDAIDAATVPVGFVDRQIAAGFTSPTAMAVAPDGRVFVAQQNGRVRLIKNDVLLAADFYATVDTDSSNERGLLGIVTDPAFTSNHYVYLYYTIRTPSPHNRILRVTERNDVALPGSERVILDMPNIPSRTRYHMGGAMRFGADGTLYVAVGNVEDDPVSDSNSQKLTNPFGKILRIHPDGSVPADNPFTNAAGAYAGIWNYGLRNPFTFDIQPGTGVMYINDVGQGSWEEVNRGVRGANYGWPHVQGRGSDSRYRNPAYAYSHGDGCAVVGAAFYNPPALQFPASYTGKFLFADFCRGWIRMLDPANDSVQGFVTGIRNPVNLGVAPDGSLYYLARNQGTGTPTAGRGTVSKITYTGSQAPRIAEHPQSLTVRVGEAATFQVAASGATSYRWQRDGTTITGATGPSYTLASPTLADDGASFRVVVGNTHGSVTSDAAHLTVTTNQRPAASILTPAAGATYDPGDTLAFSGAASDPEDGALPPPAYTWQVDLHHDAHAHPAMPATQGITSGTFSVAESHGGDANIWYRVHLTVEDSAGATTTTSRDVLPRGALSDRAWTGTPTNGYGPVERDRSNGGSEAGDGRVITLDGIPFAKGLGVHAPAEIRYDLGGACAGDFVADVGVDDEVGSTAGSVVFQVWLDGVKAYDSGLVRRADTKRAVNVGLAGKRELRLVVTDGGDGKSSDHADWAGARVTGCGGAGATPTPTPTPPPTYVDVTPPGSSATASTHDGNVPANAVDGRLDTRWSGNGDGAWLQLDLGSTRTVGHVTVAVYAGASRRSRFDIAVAASPSGPWTVVVSGAQTSGTTTNAETFDFVDRPGRYVRYIGHGNSDPAKGTWNSVTELRVFAAP